MALHHYIRFDIQKVNNKNYLTLSNSLLSNKLFRGAFIQCSEGKPWLTFVAIVGCTASKNTIGSLSGVSFFTISHSFSKASRFSGSAKASHLFF
jgi:hypothetical protein